MNMVHIGDAIQSVRRDIKLGLCDGSTQNYFEDLVTYIEGTTDDKNHIEELEIMLRSLREAFYVTGTPKAVKATFEKSHELMKKIKTRNQSALEAK